MGCIFSSNSDKEIVIAITENTKTPQTLDVDSELKFRANQSGHLSPGYQHERHLSTVSILPGISNRCHDMLVLIEKLEEMSNTASPDQKAYLLRGIEFLRDYCIPTLARESDHDFVDNDEHDSKTNFWFKSFTGFEDNEELGDRFAKIELEKGPRYGRRREHGSLKYISKNRDWLSEYLSKRVLDWDFNSFSLNSMTHQHGLTVLFRHLVIRANLQEEFVINLDRLQNYTVAVEYGYMKYDNPYHNEIHATDVLQTTYYIINESKIGNWLSKLEIFSILFAAMVHDVEHTGTNNVFHQHINSDLALLYNDRSILENHHASVAFKLLVEEDNYMFEDLHEDQYRTFRRVAIDCIMATDMASHFNQVANLKKASIEASQIVRQDLMGMILHCADVSGPGKKWLFHCHWTKLLLREFFAQGDREKKLGLTVSPLCCRNSTNIPESQIGFISYIVQPAFQTMANAIDMVLREFQKREVTTSRKGRISVVGNPPRRRSFFSKVGGGISTEPTSPRNVRRSPRGTNDPISQENVRESSSLLRSGSYMAIDRPWEEHFKTNFEMWKTMQENKKTIDVYHEPEELISEIYKSHDLILPFHE